MANPKSNIAKWGKRILIGLGTLVSAAVISPFVMQIFGQKMLDDAARKADGPGDPNGPKIEVVIAEVTGKHTEMQRDPVTGQDFKAYIIETKKGNFEGDILYKQFNDVSRKDAQTRHDTLTVNKSYKFTVGSAQGNQQPGILKVENTPQPFKITGH